MFIFKIFNQKCYLEMYFAYIKRDYNLSYQQLTFVYMDKIQNYPQIICLN